MKIAVCYSGQIGAFHKAFPYQKKTFLQDDMDIYVYTSNIVSQKNNSIVNFPTNSKIYEYLVADKGWRKNCSTYGIIYKVKQDTIYHLISPLAQQVKKIQIQNEDLLESLEDWNMSKWEWMKKRQLSKLYHCNNMIEGEYDIVVRTRFEFSPKIVIPIEQIIKSHDNIDNKIFMFGGWKCSPPMVFMDEFICDGFAFGTPRVMDVFSSLGLKSEPYSYNPKYKDCWERFGDNVEHQFKSHLDANGIEIIYIGNKRNMYHLWR